MASQEAAVTFDDNIACVRRRLSDKSDAAMTSRGEWRFTADDRTDPLCGCSGLAESAAGEHEPCEPISDRRKLFGPRPELPVMIEMVKLFRRQAVQPGFALLR